MAVTERALASAVLLARDLVDSRRIVRSSAERLVSTAGQAGEIRALCTGHDGLDRQLQAVDMQPVYLHPDFQIPIMFPSGAASQAKLP